MITRPRWREGDGPDPRVVGACLGEHLCHRIRLQRLRTYYDGKHDILQRRRDDGMPNNRLVHGFPRYISTMASGYLIGNPVNYIPTEEVDAEKRGRVGAALDAVLREYQACAIDSVDAELARCASIYGKGVELIFANASARPRSTALNPEDAFVVYDDTVEANPLFGVYFAPVRRPDGRTAGWHVHVFTDARHFAYRTDALPDLGAGMAVLDEPHFFDGVPMIEYWNDESERGDFEGVLSLIEAYDALQSDRVNDKQQFVDALLLLYGCTMETDEYGRTPGQQLREDKALVLPDSDARAEWLCKQMNEADTEILRRALKDDIHKMSMVPDLTDENFAGQSSGVAMRYKLLGLEQLTKIKERWFREGLRTRLRRYAAFMGRRGAAPLDADAVQIIFARALPVNELETAQTLDTLHGLLSREELETRARTLLNQK